MFISTNELQPAEQRLWLDYQTCCDKGLRKKSLKLLQQFITALQKYPPEKKRAWVYNLCKEEIDNRWQHFSKDFFPLSMHHYLKQPLLEKLIIPTLIDGYSHNEKMVNRWLAYFAPQLPNYPSIPGLSQKPLPGYQLEKNLLLDAIKHDLTDTVARHLLIRTLAMEFNYVTHEMPEYGLIINHMDECKQLQQELVLFIEQVTIAGLVDLFKNDITVWQTDFYSYEDYLLQRDKYSSYVDYFQQKKRPNIC